MSERNVPSLEGSAAENVDDRRFILKCGSLFLGASDGARVTDRARARRLTFEEAQREHSRLKVPNAAFGMPWEVVALWHVAAVEPTTCAWRLSPAKVSLLAATLMLRLETLSSDARRAEEAANVLCLINDLRGWIWRYGYADPFPDMSYTPHFSDSPVPPWPDRRITGDSIRAARAANMGPKP